MRLDGQDLRREPLETRKATLASLLRGCGPGLRLVEYLAHGGDVVYRHACQFGCEDIVSKRLGIVKPRAFAVLRLIASRYLVAA